MSASPSASVVLAQQPTSWCISVVSLCREPSVARHDACSLPSLRAIRGPGWCAACMCPHIFAWPQVGPWFRVLLYTSNDALFLTTVSSCRGCFSKIRVPFPDARHALALSLHRLVAGNDARHLPLVEVFLRTVQPLWLRFSGSIRHSHTLAAFHGLSRGKPCAHAWRVVTTCPSWPRSSVMCKEIAPSCALLQGLGAPWTEGCTPWLPSMHCHGCVPASSYALGLIPYPRGQLAPSDGPSLPR
ncbi:hypothetical protein V6N13_001828 [Hibiscus sabdariffa]|uniref:Uncharacterized protein n=1 Tax=Hibiscus sabdariffa TaxID=183260 RepID=A0ABR2G9W9_9ROSI